MLKLEKLGWQRGAILDGPCYNEVSRALPGGVVTAAFTPGVAIGNPMGTPEQQLSQLDFSFGPNPPPTSFSEVERDLFLAFPRRATSGRAGGASSLG